jgi:transposase
MAWQRAGMCSGHYFWGMSAAGEHIDYKALYETSLQMNQQQLQLNQQLQKSNEQLQVQLASLQHQLQQLTKLIKGFKSERYVPALPNPAQPDLGLAFDEAAASIRLTDVEKISYTRTKKAASGEKPAATGLPAELPRVTTVLEPNEEVNGCEKIGEHIHETLDYKPGELFVNRLIIPQYRCPVQGKGAAFRTVEVQRPARAIKRSIAEPGLLAQVVIDKFVDSLPLNRQQDRYQRGGITLAYSTLADWVKLVAEALEPLGGALLREMLQYDYWHADETGIAVLDKIKKQDTHQGYFWTYKTGNAPLIYYDYQPGRQADRPIELLSKFKGHLQTDGYAAYESLPNKDILLLHCMAHARRKFIDAQSNDRARADYVLAEIGKLYKIEEEGRDQQLDIEQILARRKKEAIPILTELGKWMQMEYQKLRPQSSIAKAMAYSIKRWEKLRLYAGTGHLQIDNNAIERCIRQVAIGRKNYLFCDSHEAARRAGLLYSLLVTCKLNDVNPYDWLKDILSRDIEEMPINRINRLLPHHWKKDQGLTQN